MSVVKNPKEILWTDPISYVDGAPFGASDLKGYELGVAEIDGGPITPLLVLPTAYGVGVSPIPDAVVQTKDKVQYLALRTIATNNEVSDWTSTIPVQFVSVPLAPSAFSVK